MDTKVYRDVDAILNNSFLLKVKKMKVSGLKIYNFNTSVITNPLSSSVIISGLSNSGLIRRMPTFRDQ